MLKIAGKIYKRIPMLCSKNNLNMQYKKKPEQTLLLNINVTNALT